ncbi:hypothetical protein [Dyadobacter crusticola]|uniref:hypothetical protein n=1 Tax=Dyadobacter crusticola TaxID=292407 RepID=UPI0012FAF370|nr:hypothetical protein [Dyadobacter crusticola]
MDTSERAALKYAESLSRDEIHRRDLTAAFIAGTIYAQRNGSLVEGMSNNVLADEDSRLIARMNIKDLIAAGCTLREALDKFGIAYELVSKIYSPKPNPDNQ